MTSESEPDNAWHRFCDELKRAGDVVLRDSTPGDDLTTAEGYRHLLRMVRVGFESSCEIGDSNHPEIVPMASPTKLYEGVTPDARYHHAFIDGSSSYRVRGRRGTARFIEFSVYTGQTGLHPTHDLISSLTEVDLEVDADGNFEIVLGGDKLPSNWLETGPEARRLFIRQYAADWSQVESATYEIEVLRAPGEPNERSPLCMRELTEGLARTAAFVASAPAFWADISEYWRGRAVNEIVNQDEVDTRTDITVPTGHRFACGYFELAPGEMLEVRFTPADVPLWGLGLVNYWYEPLHFPQTRSSINSGAAKRAANGEVIVFLADKDPGDGNWLPLDGHREGTMVFRWSRTHEAIPVFTTRVIAAGENR